MPSLPIVKHLDIFKNVRRSFLTGFIVSIPDPFGFQSMKETLGYGVVPAIALPAHATADAVCYQVAIPIFNVLRG
jgi:hypothetical protein